MAVATSLSVAVVIAVLPVAWRRYTERSRENDVGVEARRLFNTEHIYLPLLDLSLSFSLSLSLSFRAATRLFSNATFFLLREKWLEKMEIDRDLGRCSRIFNLTDVLFELMFELDDPSCKIFNFGSILLFWTILKGAEDILTMFNNV